MTQDEIIEMARQVGVEATGNEYWPFFIEELEAFAKLVAAKEREACANLCDEQAQNWKNPKYHFAEASANHCAKAIRARGEA
jgi:hypothetical protein